MGKALGVFFLNICHIFPHIFEMFYFLRLSFELQINIEVPCCKLVANLNFFLP